MPKAKKPGFGRRQTTSPTPQLVVPDADIRVAALAPIPALLRELNCDPAPILAKVGLDGAVFDHPDTRISFATAGALVEACVAASGVAHFGLRIGARFDISMLGVLEHLMRSSDTVRAALLQFVRHLHLNDRGAVPFLLDLGRDEVALGYAVYRHDTPGIRQVYATALAIGCRLLRALCGSSWKPTRIEFANAPPEDVAPYRRYFGVPVHFDSAHTEIVFASRWLDRELPDANASRHMAAERFAFAAEQGDGGRLVERARRAVVGLVTTGEISSRRITALLGIHERVLRRRLQAHGTNLQQMIGAARFEVARQLLGETRLTLAEIASALGYSDATAFSRAFRNWARMTPSAWRSRVATARAADIASPRRTSPNDGRRRSVKRRPS